MKRTITTRELLRGVGACRDSAVSSGRLPLSVAVYSHAATTTAISFRPHAGWTSRSVRAYFDTVARKRLLKTHSRTSAAARVIADTVVADLMSCGRSPQEAWDELSRGWGDTVPDTLLQEYRERLTA